MQLPEILTGVVGLILLVLIVAISIYWLLFPWFVYHKLDKILAALDRVAKAVALVGVQAANSSAAASAATPLPPIPGTETYHVAVGSEVTGPHTLEQIQALHAKGTIDGKTWILRQGAAAWLRLGDVFKVES